MKKQGFYVLDEPTSVKSNYIVYYTGMHNVLCFNAKYLLNLWEKYVKARSVTFLNKMCILGVCSTKWNAQVKYQWLV